MNDIQKVVLNIYKETKKILDKNDITYFAVGGTCIGAVRHNGFIPWDDDIDIAIPIEVIDEFLEVMQKELPDYLRIRTGFNDKKTEIVFIKVEDIRTTYIEEDEKGDEERYKGAFIDIMPMAGLPLNKRERNYLIMKLRCLSGLNSNIRKRAFQCTSVKGKLLCIILKPMSCIVSHDFFLKCYWKTLKKYPLKGNELVGYTWSRSLRRLIFKREYFDNTIEMPFEDTMMRCPIGWDKYLTEQFGNYMELPKLENRKSRHEGIIDIYTPYREYQLHPEKIKEYVGGKK